MNAKNNLSVGEAQVLVLRHASLGNIEGFPFPADEGAPR
jgi:hypothetical protein